VWGLALGGDTTSLPLTSRYTKQQRTNSHKEYIPRYRERNQNIKYNQNIKHIPRHPREKPAQPIRRRHGYEKKNTRSHTASAAATYAGTGTQKYGCTDAGTATESRQASHNRAIREQAGKPQSGLQRAGRQATIGPSESRQASHNRAFNTNRPASLPPSSPSPPHPSSSSAVGGHYSNNARG